jgi:hypothetical protein
MTDKSAFISFRCPDDLAAALGAYLAEHQVSRSAYIVSVLKSALGVQTAAPPGADPDAASVAELRRAVTALEVRFSQCQSMEERISSLEQNFERQKVDANPRRDHRADDEQWQREDGAQAQSAREEIARKQKAARQAGGLTTTQAYELLARTLEWDPKDRHAKNLLLDGRLISYHTFAKNRDEAFFRGLGFIADRSLRRATATGGNWLTPDPEVYPAYWDARGEGRDALT